ncbi:MAG: hypothetical protein U5K75_08970 [Ahrensia sp.]|nr:hypothetical protein [Ahrensia sp.]
MVAVGLVLFLVGLVVTVFGASILLETPTIFQEVSTLLFILIGCVLMSGGGIIISLAAIQRDLQAHFAAKEK